MDLNLKILAALDEKNKNNEFDESGKRKFRITRGTYNKTMLFSKLVTRLAGGCMECYAYHLKPKESFDDIITNLYVPSDQDAVSAHIWVTPEGVKKAGEYADQHGYEPIGWTHSHGTMGTFHSHWDVNNFKVIRDEVSTVTILKKEYATFILDNDVLKVDNYVIKNVAPLKDTKIEITKRVERKPFAFSFVVNVRGQYYAECWEKTYDSLNNQFVISEPYHPQVEIIDVDDDLEIDSIEFEWELRNKIRLNSSYDPRSGRSNSNGSGFRKFNDNQISKEYGVLANNFLTAATKYINDGGNNFKLINNLIFDNQNSNFKILNAYSNNNSESDTDLDINTVDRLKTINSIKQKIGDDDFKKYANNSKLKRNELENLIVMQLMNDFSNKNNYFKNSEICMAEQDKIIEKYAQRTQDLLECVNIAENAIKSLSRYAVETFTDYKHKKDHKYRRFINNFLTQMSYDDNSSFYESLRKITPKKNLYTVNKEILILDDRVNVFNQFVNDLYKLKKRSNFESNNLVKFLTEFSNAYTTDSNVDGVIENYLLSNKSDSEIIKYSDSIFEQNMSVNYDVSNNFFNEVKPFNIPFFSKKNKKLARGVN